MKFHVIISESRQNYGIWEIFRRQDTKILVYLQQGLICLLRVICIYILSEGVPHDVSSDEKEVQVWPFRY